MLSSPAISAAAVGVLLLGVALGWLWRGALCRRRHGAIESSHLAFFEPGEDEADAGEESGDDGAGDVTPAEYPRSAAPLPGGTAPHPAFTVKAKRGSMIYHAPGVPTYQRTIADVWFRTPRDAESAGFRAPKQRSRGAN